ncbi:MAG: PEP-CTERM sorting domain-containing protein, partial [Okeania sp. SIO2H7]|nr:PEP-CTERM sorting domain-containing protein [Okeania sp. SIO2H7]
MANVPVRVIVENLTSEEGGSILSPPWVGFHDGNFDIYDRGRPASPGIQSIAEDGDTAIMLQEFELSGLGTVDGMVGGGPILPGQMASEGFVLDSDDPQSRYFSYASMFVPSNDAWIGNGNEKEYRVFNNGGQFKPISFMVMGDDVLDAGSEVNDERAPNALGIPGGEPGNGTDENG